MSLKIKVNKVEFQLNLCFILEKIFGKMTVIEY